MNAVPDFAMQVQDVARLLEAQAQTTAVFWRDQKRAEYYKKYVTPFLWGLKYYVEGGTGIYSNGIVELTRFSAQKLNEFDNIVFGAR